MTTKVAIFKGKKIRKIIHKNEWWFSVVDVCKVLTESVDAGAYWRKLKQRLKEEGGEVVTFCRELKLEASDGKKYETDCANPEGTVRRHRSGDATVIISGSVVIPVTTTNLGARKE